MHPDAVDAVAAAQRAYQRERCARWKSFLDDFMEAGFTREEAFELVKIEFEENVMAFWAKQNASA